jgi:glycogen synthase
VRFVHVNHRYAPFVGGSERWVQEVSEAMARSGHEVAVVTTDAFDLEYFWDRSRSRVTSPRRERIGKVDIDRVPVGHLPLSSAGFRGSRRMMGELSRLPLPATVFRSVSRLQPYIPGLRSAITRVLPADALLATNLGIESLAIQGERIARDRKIPFLLTPFIHLGVEGDPIARRYVSMPHQRDLMRSADAVMVMTQVEKEFVEQYREGRGNVVSTGAGVDVAEVTGGDGHLFRRRFGAAGFLVGAVGAMARDKGTFDLVQAVIDLRKRGHDIELVLAGPPLQAFVRWYTELSDADRDGIHLLGFVSSHVKKDLLAAIDVLALPSRTESFGIVYLEAWANRRPVIGADTPASRELIGDGNTGCLVPFGDPDAISDALARLMAQPELRRTMGDAGYSETVTRHTWNHVIRRVASVYTDVLGVDVMEFDAQ